MKDRILPFLTLFTSFSTLACCALPALFISLGAGTALIGLLNAMPQLIWLSEHKTGLFILAGVMLAVSGIARYLNRNAPCPADPDQAEACNRLRRTSGVILYLSMLIYAIGFFFAFVAPYLMR